MNPESKYTGWLIGGLIVLTVVFASYIITQRGRIVNSTPNGRVTARPLVDSVPLVPKAATGSAVPSAASPNR